MKKKAEKDKPEFAKRIHRVRRGRGWSQVRFANELGVSQASVSAWESGKDVPSSASSLLLGLLTSGPDREWFWAKAGDYLEAGKAAFESAQRARGAPPLAGEIIRVPCFLQAKRGRKDTGRLLPLPTEFVPNSALTICLVVDEAAANAMLPAGEFIVLDTSQANAEDLCSFWDQVVLAEFQTRKQGGAAELAWPEGLVMGRLRCRGRDHPDDYMDMVAELMPLNFQSVPPARGLWLGDWHHEFDAPQKEQLDSPFGLLHDEQETKKRAEDQARKRLRLRPGCRILGHVIAWFGPPREEGTK
jgi:DNA-binding XRE family transcriptional regulator